MPPSTALAAVLPPSPSLPGSTPSSVEQMRVHRDSGIRTTPPAVSSCCVNRATTARAVSNIPVHLALLVGATVALSLLVGANARQVITVLPTSHLNQTRHHTPSGPQPHTPPPRPTSAAVCPSCVLRGAFTLYW